MRVGVGLYLALIFAGTDIDQGNIQRIFYIHMPAFFGAFTAFGATVFRASCTSPRAIRAGIAWQLPGWKWA
ncbi:MAG UNVERIFIED_CONTAM: hypothetical protein LVT10_17035 [Anaerolineae bacterium]